MVSVADKPYFPSEVPVVAVTEENETLTLNMTARGNPPDISYSWYRGLAMLPVDSRFWRDGGVLTVTSGLRRDEAGVYTCEASNAEGWTTHDVNIDVHCKRQQHLLSNVTYVYDSHSPDILINPLKPSVVVFCTSNIQRHKGLTYHF